ncbi:MAG: esterase-like activity of phytase family protein [Geminicoccaceae bacterium]
MRRFGRNLLLGTSALACTAFLTAAHDAAAETLYFERLATWPVFQNLPAGTDPATETVAEIVGATPDGMTLLYTDSPGERLGLVDITDPAAPAPLGDVALGGEPTSVIGIAGVALVGVNTSPSYVEPAGHLAVVDVANASVAATCDVGGQPDSVTVSPDGRFAAVAIENERDEDLNDGVIPQLPAGHLAIFDLDADGRPTNCDAARLVDLTGLAVTAPEDPEPEFVTINGANLAAVTLQENNHIAIVDLAAGTVVAHFPAGAVDLTAIDTEEDGVISPTGSLAAVPREPDAIVWLDDERLLTADEGDYEGGSRGFTIFSADGEVLYSSGNFMEHLAIAHGHYPEDRSENKGTEPEGVARGSFRGEDLFFVNSERGNFVAVFRDRPAGEPEFVQLLPTAPGPEGLLALPARDLLVVATEADSEEDGYRATLGLYRYGAATPFYPTIVSDIDPETGAPIGWGALSALAADPVDASRLHAVSDSYYGVSRIFTIDVSQQPARIVAAVDLVKDGAPAGYDLEGIAPRAGGGFWLASEGRADHESPLRQKNLLLAVAADGTVEQEIALPDELNANATNSGFEGVAAWGDGDAERVILPVQRPWKDDAANTTKLAIYDPAAASWSFVGYPLEAPKSPRGGWVGLSEITWLGDERFAVLERDSEQGAYAAIKTMTVIDLAGIEPVAYGAALPIVEKTLAIDLLPLLEASNGWISDKPEGFAVTADGRIFLVTDNDGVEDATGETQLLDLGKVDTHF